MDAPHCAALKPAVLEMSPGTYHWCGCGLSRTQPFCDGSHAGTPFGPVAVTLTEPTQVGWCQCKRSGRGPLCDGSHKKQPGFVIDPARLKK